MKEPEHLYPYRVLRHTPEIERNEWVNIEVPLEQAGDVDPESDVSRSERTEVKEPKHLYRYRVLRYKADIERDEWVNIGILLEGERCGS